jgi:tRNA pseudouridine13 synthase
MTIKRSPDDFRVEEILSGPYTQIIRHEPRPFALYRLTKQGRSTPEAAGSLARVLGVPPGQIGHAGLKDKHAATTQYLTAPALERRESADGPGWRAEHVDWVDAPITADAIAANRFCIVVRDLSQEACRRMAEGVRLLAPDDRGASAAAKCVFVNYFGDQRFGSARHGRGFLARHLVRGEFEEALRLALATWARKDSRPVKEFKRAVAEGWGRWQDLAAGLKRCPDRRAIEHLAEAPGDFAGAFAALPYDEQEMAVHAYQSYLWNATARRLVAARCAGPGPVFAVKDPFGEMLFPAPPNVPADLADLELPVLGRDSCLAEPWRTAAEETLAEEGLTTEMLRIPGLRRPQFGEAPRRLFVRAEGFDMTPPEADDLAPRWLKVTLRFDLPRGAYATVLLRALGQ